MLGGMVFRHLRCRSYKLWRTEYFKTTDSPNHLYMFRRHITHIDKSTEAIAGTMADVRLKIIKRLGLQPDYSPIQKSREHLAKYEPKLEDLPPRTMNDSFTSAIIPLSTNSSLKNKYVTFLGHVRIGRLMEDMDMFAVWVCHQHVYINNLDPNVPLPYTFVTILVDKVDFTDVIPKPDQDVRLSGHVSWVGRSSMEIVVWLEQKRAEQWQKITRALFLMAARNSTNTKAAPVNPIIPGNEEEAKILAGGESRKKRRLKTESESVWKTEPNDYEQRLIHDIFIETIQEDHLTLNKRVLPSNSKWMEESRLSSIVFSHPEDRNAHNAVFGGFLMRHALEVSWACAYMYTKRRPRLEHICDLSFKKPVPVSSFIKMSAHVVYTQMNYMQVITVADIFHPTSGEQLTTNVFHYTFSDMESIPRILPRTYHEAMWFIEGRRKLYYALGLHHQ